jgi:hypothetical protein
MKRMPNLWERREDETPKAYKAFTHYLHLDVDRSLVKVSEIIYGGKSTVNVRQLERWSVKHDWVKRAQAWDDHQRAKEAREYEKQRREAKEDRLKMIRSLKVQVAKAVVRLKPGDDEHGPGSFSTRELIEAFKVIMEQERIEYDDMPTSKTDITSGGRRIGALTADMLVHLKREADAELADFENQFGSGDG